MLHIYITFLNNFFQKNLSSENFKTEFIHKFHKTYIQNSLFDDEKIISMSKKPLMYKKK